MSAQEERLLVSTRRAAELLSISYDTMLNVLARGEIATRQIGARRLVVMESLRRYAAPEEETQAS